MPVNIQQFNDDKIYVNDKLVYLDSDYQWTAKIELTTAETEALSLHIKSLKQ